MIHLSFIYHVYVCNHVCVCYISCISVACVYVPLLMYINNSCVYITRTIHMSGITLSFIYHVYVCNHLCVCYIACISVACVYVPLLMYINDSCVYLPRTINMSGMTLSFLSLTSFSLSLCVSSSLSPSTSPSPPTPLPLPTLPLTLSHALSLLTQQQQQRLVALAP